MDKFAFYETNRRLTEECVKVVDPSHTNLEAGRVYSREAFEEERAALGEGKRKPTFEVPYCGWCEIQLLGITEVAVKYKIDH